MRTFTEDQIKAIKKAVDFRGRKVHLKEHRPGMSLNSYWNSGCRDYFYYMTIPASMGTSRILREIPQNGTPFDRENLKTTELAEHTILVEKTIINGKTTSITIYS